MTALCKENRAADDGTSYSPFSIVIGEKDTGEGTLTEKERSHFVAVDPDVYELILNGRGAL